MISLLLALAVALSPSPLPQPSYVPQTPPPEPNHVTIDALQSFLQTSGEGWESAAGVSTQLAGRYEFQAGSATRLATTFHWERLSSHYTYNWGTWSSLEQFSFNEYDDELDVELGRPEIPTGVGIGYFDYAPVYDSGTSYTLHGFGVGIDRWPNYYVEHSYYASLWYYPGVRGADPENGVYDMLRADLGYNIRMSLASPWNLRLGVQDETWLAKNEYAADTGFVGPYIAISYWR